MRLTPKRLGLLAVAISLTSTLSASENIQAAHPLSARYQRFSAKTKLTKLWSRINTPYDVLPSIGAAQLGSFGSNLCPAHLLPTFDLPSDEMKAGRKKMIHRTGVAAKIEYVPVKNLGLTGIFHSGALGVARLSLATTPTNTSFIPGAALKFLVDGKPSLNIQVMHSLDGQGTNRNFFQFPFSNHIQPPTSCILKILSYFFENVKSPATHLTLQPMAQMTRTGLMVETPVLPYDDVLILRPTAEAQGLIPSDSTQDFRVDLMEKVPVGTRLYDVLMQTATEPSGAVVGTIYTRSTFVASQYEDESLFFQHPR